jgi:hypothetical protein
MDSVCPASSEKTGQGKTKQQVPERGRIEHTGVEDGDER